MQRSAIPKGKQAVEWMKMASFEGRRVANQWRTPRFKYPGLARNMMPFSVGDEVVVGEGECKGKRGKITEMRPKSGEILVGGVNVQEGFETTRDIKGDNVEKWVKSEKPLPATWLKVINPKDNKPSDLYFKDKVRYCARTDKVLKWPERESFIYPPETQNTGPFDTPAHLATTETFQIDDPWTPPVPAGLFR